MQGLTLTCEPGVLTALMGGSGAGKTTLMDVIAGRKTQGEITGNILVNGALLSPATVTHAQCLTDKSDYIVRMHLHETGQAFIVVM